MTELESWRGRRILAVDLDNTVLDSSKRLSEPTRLALARANRAGFLVVPVSGRVFAFLKTFHASCELDGPVIGYNGASCMSPASGRVLFEEPVDPKLAERLLEFARARGAHVNFYADDLVYFDRPGPMADYYVKTFHVPFEQVADLAALGKPSVKVMLIAEADRVSALAEELKKVFAGEVDVSLSEPMHIEVLRAGVNKGRAIARLAGMIGAKAAQAIAIGDGENDVPMLRWAGRAVTVAGAHPKAIEAAEVVLGPADEDSVADFILTLIPRDS